jgi:hypothetical protein
MPFNSLRIYPVAGSFAHGGLSSISIKAAKLTDYLSDGFLCDHAPLGQ